MKLSSFLSTILLLVVTIVALHACDPTPAEKIDSVSVGQEDIERRPINDFLQPSPYFVSGELRGFRLYPGAVPTLFDELGLEAGDMVTEIDGHPLTEMGPAIELLKTLGSGDPVILDLVRQGQARQLEIQAQSVHVTAADVRIVENRPITDIFNPVPYYKNGAMVGYRLYPGDAPDVFRELGLQAGDLLVEINGQKLANFGVSFELLDELGGGASTELTFERDGEVMSTKFPAE